MSHNQQEQSSPYNQRKGSGKKTVNTTQLRKGSANDGTSPLKKSPQKGQQNPSRKASEKA